MADRSSLEDRLASLQLAFDAAEEEVATFNAQSGQDTTVMGVLGASDVVLVAAYVGGVLWRRHFGPEGPAYPVDRYVYFTL